MSEEFTHLKVRQVDSVQVVEFADRKILEEFSISEIGEELSRIVDGSEGVKILISFKNVEHLSSAALGMLITLNNKITEQKGQLRLSDITPQIFEVFKITGLNKLFRIHDTAQNALRSF
ncbi:MAG: STAS domain-containing protein [Phycisphaerales bacterium]|nr:MAG: STAS domain-containing protein [Phycisphaerales bacterium]